ncbi:hypothetical protein NC652_005934 [Populus alba x Populus x berolinensis]|nr:hypothetical protein NC652_005934 [Populus alba x Populus x berolinensis]
MFCISRRPCSPRCQTPSIQFIARVFKILHPNSIAHTNPVGCPSFSSQRETCSAFGDGTVKPTKSLASMESGRFSERVTSFPAKGMKGQKVLLDISASEIIDENEDCEMEKNRCQSYDRSSLAEASKSQGAHERSPSMKWRISCGVEEEGTVLLGQKPQSTLTDMLFCLVYWSPNDSVIGI